MSRSALGLAAVAAAAVLLLSLRWSPETPPPTPDRREVASTAARAHQASAPTARMARPGFPSRGTAGVDRSWEALLIREIEEEARRRGGDAWDEEARGRLVQALRRLRDAGARRDRSAADPDSDDAILAAARHRDAALEADALARELFGVPLAVFFQQSDPGAIEEVSPR